MQLSKVFRIPFFPAAIAAIGLGLQSCQTMEGPSIPSRNQLATGLAITSQPGFADAVFATGFNTPMAMEFGPDGALYILEKSGTVKRFKDGAVSTFLDMPELVDDFTERGLLGIAFDPDFATQRFVYIHFSVEGGTHNRVSKFQVTTANPPTAVKTSQQILFQLSPLSSGGFHNGGALHFAADKSLYITTGDNRNPASAQSMTSLLGKILRISKEYSGTPGTPLIPSGNPFSGTATGNFKAIWGLGLRNPFTFAFQPGTGRLFINDVGEQSYEEINEATLPGLNFGWPNSEGPTGLPGIKAPLGGFVNGYAANGGKYNIGDCAVIGAAFYNPSAQQFPSTYNGKYFYGDHCSKYIKYIDPAAPETPTGFATELTGLLMDLKVGPDGMLYYLTLNGTVGRINYTGSLAPTIATHPAGKTVTLGDAVTFSVVANGLGLSYQWKRAGANVGANSPNYTFTPALADNGVAYNVVVSNSSGSATSANAILTVTTNKAPVPVILTPAAGSKFNAGATINFSGSASDPEDGNLPASKLVWSVVLAHGSHTHNTPFQASGATGSFTIPVVNETAVDISYRITLKVTDNQGRPDSVKFDVQPNLITLGINTSPAGMKFNLDGQPRTGLQSMQAAVGVQRGLAALSQTFNGQPYVFQSWSDGGIAGHDIQTPAASTTYLLTYGIAGVATKVPGVIEAENYKTGGENVGYHDADAGNTGAQFRGDGVDIEATIDDGLAGFNVGWTAMGEWLDYAINVAATGNYTLTLRMASGATGTKIAKVLVGGVEKGTFTTIDASGWQSWKDVTVNGVALTAGNNQTLRISMSTGNFNFNSLKIVAAGGPVNQAPSANAGPDKSVAVNAAVALSGSGSDPENAPLTYSWTRISGPTGTFSNSAIAQPTFTPSSAGTSVLRLTVSDGSLTAFDEMNVTATGGVAGIPLPGRIQVEDYQGGGEGLGYHDLTAGNTGGVYKTDGVDIQATTDAGGGYNVGWIEAGEWLDFDVNIASAGTYALVARVASGNTGTKTLAFSVDLGAETFISFGSNAGWQTWVNAVTLGVNIPVAGAHVVRLRMVTGGMNLNYVDVATNLLANGDFASGLTGWNTNITAPAVAAIAIDAGAPKAVITNAGTQSYHIQLWQARSLIAGKAYTIDFDIKADAVPKQFKVVVENNGLWTKYLEVIQPSPAAANVWQHYSIPWTQGPADAAGRVVFDFGNQNVNDIWVDNVLVR